VNSQFNESFLGIKKGDEVAWGLEFVNDERVVFVTKKKEASQLISTS
jgi:hypothetical protein